MKPLKLCLSFLLIILDTPKLENVKKKNLHIGLSVLDSWSIQDTILTEFCCFLQLRLDSKCIVWSQHSAKELLNTSERERER